MEDSGAVGLPAAAQELQELQELKTDVETPKAESSIEEKRAEKKRKREEKKALKAEKAAKAMAKRLEGSKWQQPKQEDESERTVSRKRRGWMTRHENADDLKPAAEALQPTALHWLRLKKMLSSLQQKAKDSPVPPTWALQREVVGGTRKEATGPVLASVIKANLQQEEDAEPFNEQTLGFKNFSVFLEHAKALELVALHRDPIHRGNLWVDHFENGDVAFQQLREEAANTSANPGGDEQAHGAGIQLVEGKAFSKSAKYVAATEDGVDHSSDGSKLGGWALWESMQRPKFVCAPMVEQSELPFRMLCRRYGTTLAYTPMIHSRLFCEDVQYRREAFTTCPEDRPLIVQFCANDPDTFVAAARLVEGKCDAVDLNLGCPQGIAKKGHYGSFLMDDFDLVFRLINAAHKGCRVPITAKIRIFPDETKTLQYAKMCVDAGAQVLTVHGRTRENKGATATPADWSIIRKVKEHVGVPIIANGNISQYQDVLNCLEATACDGVMSAEWLRRNPALFSPPSHDNSDAFQLTSEYLELCNRYPCPVSFIRSHLFKLLTGIPGGLTDNPDLRQELQEAKTEAQMRDIVTRLATRRAEGQVAMAADA